MTLPHLIGIHGPKQSGKDTTLLILRDALEAKYGLKVFRLAFADELKKECARALGECVEHLDNNKLLFRPLLQWWGTEYRRGQDTEYWIKKWKAVHDYVKAQHPNLCIVVPDVRFYNEYRMIKDMGGEMIRIEVMNKPSVVDKHASEHPLPETMDAMINDFNDQGVLVNAVLQWIERKYD